MQQSFSIDGQSGYLLVLIDAGEDGLSVANQQQEWAFYNESSLSLSAENADRVIGIHIDEWLHWMTQRVCGATEMLPQFLSEWHEYKAVQCH